MMSWLIDTFIWTGVLIAVILVLRRPVAKAFGPKMAYALWALPLLRLVLPPVVLPAWMAPQTAAVSPAETAGDATPAALETLIVAPEAIAPTAVTTAPAAEWPGLTSIALLAWLVGAAAFLVWRVVEYQRMRDDLLADSLPLGSKEKVRLVESPAVRSPVAFGVLDKVVALPVGFIAQPDIHARDLAIAHELAHHKGGDLAANMAAQPLLAFHWFNPLAWLGWRAMRRDQEAACDARVIEQCGQEEKAAYGQVIAGFAAGPHLALAAPMACPILGEKSVIHRLRRLNMKDVSSRRRLIGRTLLASAALALPLTASVSYAEETRQEASIEEKASDENVRRWTTDDGKEIVIKTVTDSPEVDVEEILAEIENDSDLPADADVDVQVTEEDGKRVVRKTIKIDRGSENEGDHKVEKKVHRKVHIHRLTDADLSEEDRAKLMEEFGKLRTEFAPGGSLHEELKKMRIEFGQNGEAREAIQIALAESRNNMPKLFVACQGDEPKTEWLSEDGQKVTMICKSKITASAAESVRKARDQIANDPNIRADIREQVLKSLDEEIARLNQDG